MNHVLFISYDGLTDPLGQSQIIPYLCGLTKYNFRFSIISCEKPDRFQKLGKHIHSLLSDYPITWIPLRYHKKPPIISTVYDLQKIKNTAKRIHLRDRIDLVHTRSGTPALAGLWLKKKFGIKFLNDIRDFYAQSRVDSGQWPQDKFLYRQIFKYFSGKEKLEMAAADGIVCLTHKAAEIIKQSFHHLPIPVSVIPCSVDLDLFDPGKIDLMQKEMLRKRFGISSNDIVFTYLGSVGTWYLAAEMFALFKRISNAIPGSKLLVVSPDDENDIQTYAVAANIPKEKISITSAQRQEVPALLSLSNYAVFFIKPCYSKQASSPTKLGEIMAMGLPVITNEGVGDVSQIVRKYDAGIVINDLNKEGFDEAISKILNQNFDGNIIRNGATEYFDLNKAVDCYHQIYCNILGIEVAKGSNNKEEIKFGKLSSIVVSQIPTI